MITPERAPASIGRAGSTHSVTTEPSLAKAEQLGGTRTTGPAQVMDGVEVGLVADPEGHPIGVIRGARPLAAATAQGG